MDIICISLSQPAYCALTIRLVLLSPVEVVLWTQFRPTGASTGKHKAQEDDYDEDDDDDSCCRQSGDVVDVVFESQPKIMLVLRKFFPLIRRLFSWAKDGNAARHYY